MRLESYVYGQWRPGKAVGRALVNPVTGAEIARADSTGVDCHNAGGYIGFDPPCRKPHQIV